ncbi:MAG: sugar phosphate isomerase/epimerase [Prolixibacteraceae bacterium]|jgi:sugar phosphate isomerase/epimerase|nr:sugar phosphate isomerase/epimerase [Prolixibacteraceae bacterium]MBT6998757.1 sugar phosphate isomerase/epimerase [Prolixibacteraceae bacterium]MBT7394973.1 sugar phosphate isomerase/epimerase [Prolixibacteraceae bacterium]
MTNRRKFLKTTAAFAAGSMVLPMVSCTKEKVIGLQLYTVRDKITQDLDGTLNRLAEIGYNSMEAAGYNVVDGTFYGMKPKAFADKLKGLGMPLHSSHTVAELDTAEKVFADAAEAGCRYVIYPYLPEEFRQNIDGYKATAEKFNKIGEVANKHGVRFGYHNHAFEFDKMDGQIGMDVLISETDPELVTFEVDLYWVTKGGHNPVDYIKTHPGRFEIYHVKDMVKTDDMFFSPVGVGRIDFESIFAIKETAGMEMIFVEQDRFRDYDAFESVEMSFNYLNNADFV